MGKGKKYRANFAWEMAEEYAVDIDPYQFEPMTSESDVESSHDNNTKSELVKLNGMRVRLFVAGAYTKRVNKYVEITFHVFFFFVAT